MSTIRRQLTLFLDVLEASMIEAIRQEFNPEQYKLIKAHVTLCREDELVDIEKVMNNLENLRYEPFIINFGQPERFSNGRGVRLPAVDDDKFQKLRRRVLMGVADVPKRHCAHVTLMHPRNSDCTDEIFQGIMGVSFPTKLMFDEVSLIEQEEGECGEC